jgi:hypothetical protein
MHSNNKKVLSEGFHVGSQTPLDDRLVFTNMTDLQDLGTDDVNAYRYYEGLFAWVVDDHKGYIWEESATGALVTSYTYPANHIVNGVDYSGRSFNWVEAYITTMAVSAKYSEQFDASSETLSVAKTITHSLNTTSVLVELWDDTTGELIEAQIDNRTSTTLDITFRGALPAGDVTIVITG